MTGLWAWNRERVCMNLLWAQPPFCMRMEAKPARGVTVGCTSILSLCQLGGREEVHV